VSPILFHAQLNGFTMNTYFFMAEIVDVYGVWVVAFLFIGALVLYRNKLMQIFAALSTKTSVVKQFNRTKELLTSRNLLNALKKSISNVFNAIKQWFRK